MSEIFYSIRSSVSVQAKIEGSRFIADAIPVSREDEATEHIERIRKQYFDATHHCFAYVIGAERSIVRHSDDGEPSGSAGIKIHNAIQSKNLSDTLVVITRYFGGTKLGVGGLGRAYFDTAAQAIHSAHLVSKATMKVVDIRFTFDDTNPVMNAVHSNHLKVIDTLYTNEASLLRILVLPSHYERIKTTIIDATRARAEVLTHEEKTVIV